MNRALPILIANLLALGLLAACGKSKDPVVLGTLEWDRISLPAEASEPVLELDVAEGATVKAGDRLLRLDDRRLQAKLAQAMAEQAAAEAQLSELVHGARPEQLDAARAAVASAEAGRVEAQKQYARQADLAAKQLVARSTLDAARATLDRNVAALASARAQLDELLHGTRAEQVAQADAAMRAAQSATESLRLNLARLDVRAPRAGRVDALPFKPGDQPPAGASVASLLVGSAPYARVFVPSAMRASVHEGDKFLLRVKGIDHDLHAHLRSIASEASFTPYYALTGDDASRLVYRAELVVDDSDIADLPAGLPVEARRAP
jgi:HlyD family secretion protein